MDDVLKMKGKILFLSWSYFNPARKPFGEGIERLPTLRGLFLFVVLGLLLNSQEPFLSPKNTGLPPKIAREGERPLFKRRIFTNTSL